MGTNGNLGGPQTHIADGCFLTLISTDCYSVLKESPSASLLVLSLSDVPESLTES